MTPQELKNSILQLAVQGKLVEQRPEEGTGEELYRQIQAEKRRLIKAGRIKKDKPLPEIAEDEIPFDIPESWKWVRLSTIGITQTGNTPSKSHPEYIGIDIPFITPGDILNGQVCYNNQALSLLGKNVARVCDEDSIMQVCIGGSIGKVAITDRKVAFNQQINVVSPLFCLSKYLFAVMQSAYFTISMKERAGGTATPIINRGLWDSLCIPLPPISEQKRIVAKIEELLPYIDRYAASYERLEQVNTEFPEDMKKSVLQYAIQGKLVEQRPEEGTAEELYRQIQTEKKRLIKEGKIKKEKPLPEIAEDEIQFDIPESWKWVRIGALTYNWGQKTPDSRFCYIDVGSVNNTSHTLNKENTVVEAKDASSRAKKIVKKGDVIFATIRPYLKNICIIDKDFPYEPIASTAFAVMHCPEGLLNKYLYYYLLSPTFMRFANARDKAKGVAYPAIGEKDFFNGIIALPPVAEQKRIVAKLEEILPLCERLK